MTTMTEGRHTAAFILSEANGNRSRENGTVKLGQVLAAGEVVSLNGTELVTYTATGTAAVGVIIEAVDATDAAVKAAYIARDAEVNLHLLTFPDTSDDDDDETVATLKLLGIIARA